MFVSAREAATILGVTRDQARWVLAAGLAGPTHRTRGAVLHERARVEALASRPEPAVTSAGVPGTGTGTGTGPREFFVARVLNRGLDVRESPEAQRATLREDWPVSPLARVELRLVVDAHGYVPLVATVCGFVAAGAEITDVLGSRKGHGRTGRGRTGTGTQGADLVLRAPGAWFETFRECRLPTGPGAPWLLWNGPLRKPWAAPETPGPLRKPLAEPPSRS